LKSTINSEVATRRISDNTVSEGLLILFDFTCLNEENVVSQMYVLANIEQSFRAQFRKNG